jgi:hypothetical protein
VTKTQDSRTAIIVAAIGLVGILSAAVIGNLGKITSVLHSHDFKVAPTPVVTPPQSTDVVGTWIGKNSRSRQPITLVIDHQEGDSFSGTLIHKSWRIAFVGSLSGEKVVIRDTRILGQNVDTDGNWSLTERKGIISSDKKQMSLVGEDNYGILTAMFVKQP